MAEYTYRGEPGSFKIEAILDALIDATIPSNEIPHVEGASNGSWVKIRTSDSIPAELVEAVMAAHDPTLPSKAEIGMLEVKARRAVLSTFDLDYVRTQLRQAKTIEDVVAWLDYLLDDIGAVIGEVGHRG